MAALRRRPVCRILRGGDPVNAIGRALYSCLPVGIARLVNEYSGPRRKQRQPFLQTSYRGARLDISESARVQLVRLCRYFERRDAIFNKLADLFEMYTVGRGLLIQPSTSSKRFNEGAAEWLAEWSLRPDLGSNLSLGSIQGLWSRGWFTDGESFVLKARDEANRPAIQTVEGHLCATPPALVGTPYIVDGVRLSPKGRPLGYFIADEDEKGNLSWPNGETPAEQVIHIYEPSRPQQIRGLPIPYPSIEDLWDLLNLQNLEMQAAARNADVTNVLNTESGELDTEDLVLRAATDNPANGKTRQEYVQEIVGGRTIALGLNEKFTQHIPQRPSAATAEYWRFLTEKICVGVGIPYVLVFPESMQGTTYRGSLEAATAFFLARFETLASATRAVYEHALGLAKNQDKRLEDAPADWRACVIYPPRAPDVDIGRNNAATLAQIAAGAASYDMIYGPQGLHWRQQFDRLAEQIAYAKKIGLPLVFPGQQQQPAPDQEEPFIPKRKADRAA